MVLRIADELRPLARPSIDTRSKELNVEIHVSTVDCRYQVPLEGQMLNRSALAKVVPLMLIDWASPRPGHLLSLGVIQAHTRR